jgi:hypothetical protein
MSTVQRQDPGPPSAFQPVTIIKFGRMYLTERFPVISLGGTVLSAYACSYLLYGEAHGEQVFAWPTVVGAFTVVLLAIVRRIVDDLEDLGEDLRSGRYQFPDGGEGFRKALVWTAVGIASLVGLLNATCSLTLAIASLAVAAWFPLAMAIKNRTGVKRSRLARYIVVESCPVAYLLYGYLAWAAASNGSLPATTVAAVVGLFWTCYQFWNFTRKVGTDGWPAWELTVAQTRPPLLLFVALAAVLTVLIANDAGLAPGWSLYGLALSATFLVAILRWWPPADVDAAEVPSAWWSGLPFPAGVEVGVLVAVLVAAIR